MNDIITAIKRGRHSVNGNPSFTITLASGRVLRTAPDIMWAYAVDDSMIGHAFIFTLDKGNRIRYATEVAS